MGVIEGIKVTGMLPSTPYIHCLIARSPGCDHTAVRCEQTGPHVTTTDQTSTDTTVVPNPHAQDPDGDAQFVLPTESTGS